MQVATAIPTSACTTPAISSSPMTGVWACSSSFSNTSVYCTGVNMQYGGYMQGLRPGHLFPCTLQQAATQGLRKCTNTDTLEPSLHCRSSCSLLLLIKFWCACHECSTAQTCFPPPSPQFIFAAGNCQTSTCGSRIPSLTAANSFYRFNSSNRFWSLKAIPPGMNSSQWVAYVNVNDHW